MAEIVLDDVSKEYADGTVAVSDLNLDIEDGEFVVLVGPVGVREDDRAADDRGPRIDQRRHAVHRRSRGQRRAAQGARHRDGVPELRPVSPHDRVRQHGVRPEAPEAPEGGDRPHGSGRPADILGLEELLQRKPKALSGGQRQRVAMGRAIVREPKAFLMDEPLSNLDAKLRVQMRTEIARIQHELRVTTIYVTHDQVEAMTMGDRVAVIRKGKLQQVDTPQRLYDHPVNLFVAGFIGSPAMNLVEATLLRDERRGVRGVRRVQKLSMPPEVRAPRGPGLAASRDGRSSLGIRPEDMEDASLHPEAPADRRIRPTSSCARRWARTWWSTSRDAPAVVTEDTQGACRTTSDTASSRRSDAGAATRSSASWPGSAPGRAPRGQPIELVVDTSRFHFFDPETGPGDLRAPRADASTGTTSPAASDAQNRPLSRTRRCCVSVVHMNDPESLRSSRTPIRSCRAATTRSSRGAGRRRSIAVRAAASGGGGTRPVRGRASGSAGRRGRPRRSR